MFKLPIFLASIALKEERRSDSEPQSYMAAAGATYLPEEITIRILLLKDYQGWASRNTSRQPLGTGHLSCSCEHLEDIVCVAALTQAYLQRIQIGSSTTSQVTTLAEQSP
ncbi:uncharacterized protein LOC110823252 [Carica papaya]|uniref:uncharacterized protein LOC110823252 n=1 Tax=Carica papaya TaxID=3649 RepID=UPI000B8CFC7C|nr:uncharacterized protein LOC110823252 [Carica papaya]